MKSRVINNFFSLQYEPVDILNSNQNYALADRQDTFNWIDDEVNSGFTHNLSYRKLYLNPESSYHKLIFSEYTDDFHPADINFDISPKNINYSYSEFVNDWSYQISQTIPRIYTRNGAGFTGLYESEFTNIFNINSDSTNIDYNGTRLYSEWIDNPGGPYYNKYFLNIYDESSSCEYNRILNRYHSTNPGDTEKLYLFVFFYNIKNATTINFAKNNNGDMIGPYNQSSPSEDVFNGFSGIDLTHEPSEYDGVSNDIPNKDSRKLYIRAFDNDTNYTPLGDDTSLRYKLRFGLENGRHIEYVNIEDATYDQGWFIDDWGGYRYYKTSIDDNIKYNLILGCFMPSSKPDTEKYAGIYLNYYNDNSYVYKMVHLFNSYNEELPDNPIIDMYNADLNNAYSTYLSDTIYNVIYGGGAAPGHGFGRWSFKAGIEINGFEVGFVTNDFSNSEAVAGLYYQFDYGGRFCFKSLRDMLDIGDPLDTDMIISKNMHEAYRDIYFKYIPDFIGNNGSPDIPGAGITTRVSNALEDIDDESYVTHSLMWAQIRKLSQEPMVSRAILSNDSYVSNFSGIRGLYVLITVVDGSNQFYFTIDDTDFNNGRHIQLFFYIDSALSNPVTIILSSDSGYSFNFYGGNDTVLENINPDGSISLSLEFVSGVGYIVTSATNYVSAEEP